MISQVLIYCWRCKRAIKVSLLRTTWTMRGEGMVPKGKEASGYQKGAADAYDTPTPRGLLTLNQTWLLLHLSFTLYVFPKQSLRSKFSSSFKASKDLKPHLLKVLHFTWKK